MPNSTADKTKNRNVNDKRLILSYVIPIESVKKYKVIQRISAVKSKCKAELTLMEIELSIKIKTTIKRLISPIYIILL